MAEGEIRARREVPRSEAAVQHVVDELFGGHLAEFFVEGQFVEDADMVRGQGVRPFGR